MKANKKPAEIQICTCSKVEGLRQLEAPECDAFLVLTEGREGQVVYSNMPPAIVQKLIEAFVAETKSAPVKITFRGGLN